MDLSRSTCGSWLTAYMGPCSQPVFILASHVVFLRRPSLNSGLYFLFSWTWSPSHEHATIATLSASSHSHWTHPVSREETLARREQFRKIGWHPPNHKPNIKKVVAYAKDALGEARDSLRGISTNVLSRCKRLTACSRVL